MADSKISVAQIIAEVQPSTVEQIGTGHVSQSRVLSPQKEEETEISEDKKETKMIVIWIMTIKVCYIIFLIALMNFKENLVIYCMNWVVHFAVSVCLALLKWTEINSKTLLKTILLLLHARILMAIVQRQST